MTMRINKPSRPAALRIAGVTVVGAAIIVAANGPGVFAGLKATASTVNNPMAATSGTLELKIDSTGLAAFSADVSDLAPGDTVTRKIQLNNDGTLAGKALKLKVTPDDATSVLATGAKALTVAVQSCDANYANCSSAMAATAISGLADFAAFTGGTTMDANTGKAYLKITVGLPDVSEETVDGVLPSGTVQGKSINLTYTFQETQRDGAATPAA